ncbi:UDP-N-acetylmuramate dehydrogenase [Marivirga sp. S37H4]|uniref:UDP-N-acetylenolpyruvoylglucosamine reductase n=1 Tax=Marivirga aurantiaca TaxID=2802615 RepID=A0A934WXZ8_9BACT|nr:UDP-N-acetylmuramate dehydrogenase [Marivirga aurantiaca]MBK6264886.1 UDP-N-acetylmuramate dehydrogenase [Marivirga aurantiaca]
MVDIKKAQSLKPFNTFGFDLSAKYLVELRSVADFLELRSTWQWKDQPHLIIGGGSNILLRHHFEGLVVINRMQGLEIIEKQEDFVLVKAGAGMNWHEFVLFSIEQNLGGLENLSLIPGTVGAAPMQNIGAYGVEIKETFHSLEAVNLNTGELEIFDTHACQFGYRDSVFKAELKDQYLITSVTFKLVPAEKHRLSLEYGVIRQVLEEKNIISPRIKDVSDAVISIRQSKLPDPGKIGNSGSFFKNPTVSKEKYEQLKAEYPEIPGYVLDADTVKLAAGWLIEKAGWKGYKENGVGVHEKQALVLVNHGEGSGKAIEILAKKIQDSVLDQFGVALNPEVNFI